jgi:hypothetical protein
MQRRHSRRSAAAALLLSVFAIAPLAAAPAAPAEASPAPAAVSITVESMTPTIPAPKYGLHPLRFTLSIANRTDAALHDVTITAVRANPLTSAAQLDAAVARPTAPTTTGQALTPVRPVTVNLPPASQSAAVTTTFVTTASVSVSAELCQCYDHAVYPVWFSAYAVTDGVTQLLGQAQTFVSSFVSRPAPLHVSWVWPIIDRPHRLVGSTTFTDDGLAASVSTGRLSRCLQVLENVAGTVPITVVLDPELLDELEVMATHKYRYRDQSGHLVPGTGSQAAAAWLARLQAVLQTNSQVAVVLTPNGDPDVAALARAGLSWSATLPSAEQQRVHAALGGVTPVTTFAWPPSGTIGPTALRELYGTGVTSLLLDSQAVTPQTGTTGAPTTLARLRSGTHRVVAALSTPDLARYTAAAIGAGAASAGLPELMAELTLSAAGAQQPGQQVFLAPPRYVDPDVELASNTITQTSSSVLTRPANLLDTLAAAGTAPLNEPPVATAARLQAQHRRRTGLPPASIRVARSVTNSVSSLNEMFDGSAPAHAFVDELYNAVQLIESAAWRRGSGLGGRRLGVKFAHELRAQIRHLERGVHIVRPAAGSYTLASTNSPLPITVENDLPYPVHVQVKVHTVNSLPGLDAGAVGPQEIDPTSKATLHVPTQVQRSGTFKVFAFLQTPDGRRIGPPSRLSVHSTALGTIGVIITIVSGAVLVLALVLRFVRRWRTRRREPARRRPWSPESAEPAESPASPEGPAAASTGGEPDGAQPADAPLGALTDFLTTPGGGSAPPPAS